MGKDYYKILDVDKSANQEEIKRAFRKLAHKYHPDKPDGDEAKFKEINEAYQVLGNEEKRQQFDQYGSTFDQQGGFGGGMNWSDFMNQARQGGGQNMNFDFSDIFGDMFGFGGGRQRQQQQNGGRDIQADLQITLEDAYSGVKKEVELYKNIKCDHCHGNGAEPGTAIKDCDTCKGTGQVTRVQRTILGAIQTRAVCPDCEGRGKKIEKKCSKCGGSGLMKSSEKIQVDIPAGIDDGQSLRLSNLGEAGINGSANGDLYITVRIKNHADFDRQGADIYSKIDITYSQAVLGDKVEVRTINGTVKLSIPSGTSSGTMFKLRGKGMPKLNGYGNGNHYVKVFVNIPSTLNREQKKIVKQMQEIGL